MVVDTSVWLAILLAQPLKDKCLKEIKGKDIFVPSLCFYECYKKIRSKCTEAEALEAISALHAYPALEVNAEIALTAADLSLEYSLAMADSLVLSHARVLGVPLLTLDNDFSDIPGVKVLR